VAERIQEPLASGSDTAQPDERVPAGVVLNLDRFKVLLAGVLDRAPEDRAKVAGEIIDLLIAMRDPGHDAAEAAVILKQLDLKSFSGVIDAEGRNARKEAVETLMHMGFPHALKISPEDFEWAREVVSGTPPGQRAARQKLVVFGTMFASMGLAIISAKLGLPSELSGVLAGASVSAFIFLIVSASNERKT
jgi:hypothetical protein